MELLEVEEFVSILAQSLGLLLPIVLFVASFVVFKRRHHKIHSDLRPTVRNTKILTGILVDVSGSMERSVGDNRPSSDQIRKESWAKSIFKFIDRLIKHDASSDQQVFVIGVGSSCPEIIFDVLKTLKALKAINDKTNAEIQGYHPALFHGQPIGSNKLRMLDKALRIIEYNGAPRVRQWASLSEISDNINEWTTAIFLNALEDNLTFRGFRFIFIYHCLPASCRELQHSLHSYAAEIAIGTVGSIPEVHRLMTEDSVKDVIEKGVNLLKNYEILKTVTSEAVRGVKDASEILRDSVGEEDLTDRRTDELIESIKPFIYGGTTPLMQSLHEAVKLLTDHTDHQYKLLFVLSDGQPTDGDNPPLRELAYMDVTVVCCFITNRSIEEPRRLYSSESPEWEKDAKFMFGMSSAISTQKIPRTMFVKKGWKIDIDNNETRMFFQINHPDLINEVCDLARECVCSQDALADVLSSVSLDIYINRANEGVSPTQQEEETCYAVASATVMHLAMQRIVGRDGGYPDFYQIRDELIDKYGKKGAKVGEVLQEVCPRYRLWCRKTDESGALSAIVEKRPVVAIFALTKDEWSSFYNFYDLNPRDILRKEHLGISTRRGHDETLRGHAVVLTSFNSECLRLMNSRAHNRTQNVAQWADGGFFRVQNAAVLGFQFYDIFWTEEDLLPAEKEAYARYGPEISAKLMNSLTSLQTATYKCPQCSEESIVSEFRGHLLAAQCPRCGGTFNANEADSNLALNIYLTSLLK